MNEIDKPKSASTMQKEELVCIFEEYAQHHKLDDLDDSKERSRFWNAATQRLNKMEGGTTKSLSKWVKYWADVIINLRRKCRLVVEGRSRKVPPTPLEVRILRASNCYDVLEQWMKAVDQHNSVDISLSGGEEYYPDDTGVQKEEIVVENFAEDPLDEEEQYVTSYTTKSDIDPNSTQIVTTELHIRKPSIDELKSLTAGTVTAETPEYVELTTVDASTCEFLRPKQTIQHQPERLKENLKRSSEKLETVMKKRKIEDSKYAIAQALTNMSSAVLALSHGLNDLANALVNDVL
uniref:Regulatory protein zeste n=1 Tax=Anopheles triannulatus TaxID=58253 RepID=A0A2M4AYN7_9DIPT